MPAKEFLVSVYVTPGDEWALELSEVQQRIVSAIGYQSTICVDSVTEFNREDYTFIRLSKIPAIKRVREILECSLLEAKMIVDEATKRQGEITAFGVIVSYDPEFGANAYHVKKA